MPKRCKGTKGTPHVVHVTRGGGGNTNSTPAAAGAAAPATTPAPTNATDQPSTSTTGRGRGGRGRGRGRGGNTGTGGGRRGGGGTGGGGPNRGHRSASSTQQQQRQHEYDLSDFDLLDELIEQNNAIHAAGTAQHPPPALHQDPNSPSDLSTEAETPPPRANGESVVIDNRLVDLQRPRSRHGGGRAGLGNVSPPNSTDLVQTTSVGVDARTPTTPDAGHTPEMNMTTAALAASVTRRAVAFATSENTAATTSASGHHSGANQVTPSRPRSAGRGTGQQGGGTMSTAVVEGGDINSPQAIAAALRRLHENDGVMEEQYAEGDRFLTEGRQLSSPKLDTLRQELEVQQKEVERLKAFQKERYELVESLRALKSESAEVSAAGGFTYDTQASDELRFHASAMNSRSANVVSTSEEDVADDDERQPIVVPLPATASTTSGSAPLSADFFEAMRAYRPTSSKSKKKQVARANDGDDEEEDALAGLPSVAEIEAIAAAMKNLFGPEEDDTTVPVAGGASTEEGDPNWGCDEDSNDDDDDDEANYSDDFEDG